MKTKFILITSILASTLPFISGCDSKCTLTLVNNNPEMGDITGEGVYPKGTKVTIEATPNEYYSFDSWDLGEKTSGKAKYTFEITKSMTIEASFIKQKYSIDIKQFEYMLFPGTVNGDKAVEWGETADLEYIPYAGFKADKWISQDNSNVLGTGNNIQFEMPKQSLNIKLSFADNVIEFGHYPQTKVTDSYLISTFNGIYLADGEVFTYNTKQYYKMSSDLYFYYEPVRWNIIEESSSQYTLIAESGLDHIVPSDLNGNYETSNIRNFLIHDFVDLCFSDDEKVKMMPRQVTFSNTGTSLNDNIYIPFNINSDQEDYKGKGITYKPCKYNDYFVSRGGTGGSCADITGYRELTYAITYNSVDASEQRFKGYCYGFSNINSSYFGIKPVIIINKN